MLFYNVTFAFCFTSLSKQFIYVLRFCQMSFSYVHMSLYGYSSLSFFHLFHRLYTIVYNYEYCLNIMRIVFTLWVMFKAFFSMSHANAKRCMHVDEYRGSAALPAVFQEPIGCHALGTIHWGGPRGCEAVPVEFQKPVGYQALTRRAPFTEGGHVGVKQCL